MYTVQNKYTYDAIRELLTTKTYLMGAILRTSDIEVIRSLTYLHLTDLHST